MSKAAWSALAARFAAIAAEQDFQFRTYAFNDNTAFTDDERRFRFVYPFDGPLSAPESCGVVIGSGPTQPGELARINRFRWLSWAAGWLLGADPFGLPKYLGGDTSEKGENFFSMRKAGERRFTSWSAVLAKRLKNWRLWGRRALLRPSLVRTTGQGFKPPSASSERDLTPRSGTPRDLTRYYLRSRNRLPHKPGTGRCTFEPRPHHARFVLGALTVASRVTQSR